MTLGQMTFGQLDHTLAHYKVPNEHLPPKLNRHGIFDSILLWFRHFLKSNQQTVVIYSMEPTPTGHYPWTHLVLHSCK